MVSARNIFILHPKISILWQCHWISLWSENGSLFIESDPFSDHESTFCFLNFVTSKEPLVKIQGWKMFNMDQTWRWASIENSYIHLGGGNLTFKIRFFHVFREIWKRGNFVLHISLWKQYLQRKWNTAGRSQWKNLRNSHLRCFIFDVSLQRFFAAKFLRFEEKKLLTLCIKWSIFKTWDNFLSLKKITFKGPLLATQGVQRVFQWWLKGVFRVVKGYSKGVLRVFQGRFTDF